MFGPRALCLEMARLTVRALVRSRRGTWSSPAAWRSGSDTPCSKVMAGPGPDCVNDQPNAVERAAVAEFFAHHKLGDPMPDWSVGTPQTATPEPSAAG